MLNEIISNKIFLVRKVKVMLDKDLAELYGVSTGNLNKAVKRNIKRFPDDFMFQLTEEEFEILKFQIGISSWGGTRISPYQDKNIEPVFSYLDELITNNLFKKKMMPFWTPSFLSKKLD